MWRARFFRRPAGFAQENSAVKLRDVLGVAVMLSGAHVPRCRMLGGTRTILPALVHFV